MKETQRFFGLFSSRSLPLCAFASMFFDLLNLLHKQQKVDGINRLFQDIGHTGGLFDGGNGVGTAVLSHQCQF
jgi:hypothetical protein